MLKNQEVCLMTKWRKMYHLNKSILQPLRGRRQTYLYFVVIKDLDISTCQKVNNFAQAGFDGQKASVVWEGELFDAQANFWFDKTFREPFASTLGVSTEDCLLASCLLECNSSKSSSCMKKQFFRGLWLVHSSLLPNYLWGTFKESQVLDFSVWKTLYRSISLQHQT